MINTVKFIKRSIKILILYHLIIMVQTLLISEQGGVPLKLFFFIPYSWLLTVFLIFLIVAYTCRIETEEMKS